MLRQVQTQLHPTSGSNIRKCEEERQQNSHGHYTVLLLRKDLQILHVSVVVIVQ
jgi:hypothetical protein